MLAVVMFASGVVACAHRARPHASPARPLVIDVPPRAPAPARSAPPPSCASLETEQRVAVERALATLAVDPTEPEATDDDREDTRRVLEELGRWCTEDERGVWMLRADSAVRDDPSDRGSPVSLGWSLVRIAPDGGRVALANPLLAEDGEPLRISSMIFVDLDEPKAFDFDGDGTSEVFLHVRGHYHESTSWSVGRIFTLRRDSIDPYGPANAIAIDEIRDVDGDGRPDLLGYGPFDAVLTGCCSGFDHRVTGPLLVAHARPDGTFALGDDVARREATAACAAATGAIVEESAPWDEREIALRVACARLSGVSGRAVIKQLDDARRATRGTPRDACDLDTCTDRDEVRTVLGRWADLNLAEH